ATNSTYTLTLPDALPSQIGASYKGTIQALGSTRFSGNVDLNVPSVRDFAQWLGSPLPAGGGFGPLTITGNAQGSGNSYTFSNARSEEHTSELQSRENLVC